MLVKDPGLSIIWFFIIIVFTKYIYELLRNSISSLSDSDDVARTSRILYFVGIPVIIRVLMQAVYDQVIYGKPNRSSPV